MNKKNDPVFNLDIHPLLSVDQINQYQIEEAYDVALNQFIARLKGDPWKGSVK